MERTELEELLGAGSTKQYLAKAFQLLKAFLLFSITQPKSGFQFYLITPYLPLISLKHFHMDIILLYLRIRIKRIAIINRKTLLFSFVTDDPVFENKSFFRTFIYYYACKNVQQILQNNLASSYWKFRLFISSMSPFLGTYAFYLPLTTNQNCSIGLSSGV